MKLHAIHNISLLLLALAIIFISCQKNSLVTSKELEKFATTYLKTYEKLLLKNIKPKYRKYIDFYNQYPYRIKATISATHGAALEFIPSSKQFFEMQKANKKIEHAIFIDEDISLDKQIIKDVAGIVIEISNLTFITKKGYFINVLETGSVLIKNVTVDEIDYDHAILIKGSNKRKYWTKKIARRDASGYFRSDLSLAFIMSEEFRKFVSIPKLSDTANKILEKQMNGEYSKEYGYLQREEDLEEFYNVAKKYGVSNKFADEIFNFRKEVESRPSWLQRNLIGIIIIGIISSLIAYAIIALISKILKNRKLYNKDNI